MANFSRSNFLKQKRAKVNKASIFSNLSHELELNLPFAGEVATRATNLYGAVTI
jgi:hypothetical protein